MPFELTNEGIPVSPGGLPIYNIYTGDLGSGAVSIRATLNPGHMRISEAQVFVRGDFNEDGRTDILDAILSLQRQFLGGTPPRFCDMADSNDDGKVNLVDAIYILRYRFLGGPPPPAPFPLEGTDPTADELDSC